jgi:hypothetical protein
LDEEGELIKTEVDPNTFHIMLDMKEAHYYAISKFQRFLFSRKNPERIYCYWCFCSYNQETYPGHSCYGKNIPHYQCDICKDLFFNKTVYDSHMELESPGWDCDCCEKDVFRGVSCWDKHFNTNCQPPETYRRAKCPLCARNYKASMEHECKPYEECRNCGETFGNYKYLQVHTCYMNDKKQKRKAKGNTVRKLKQQKTDKGEYFEAHWFYDFETCRMPEDIENDTGKYRHEVMAWAMKLICLPFNNEKNWTKHYDKMYQQIFRALQKVPVPLRIKFAFEVVESDHEGLPSIVIRGRDLDTFMKLIFSHLKTKTLRPVLWAHNGSKFDGKFILNHILNEWGYDLAGDSYQCSNRLAPEAVQKDGIVQYEWKKLKAKLKNKNLCQVSMIGSKALSIRADDVTFRCSWAHLAAPLSKLPKMFGFADTLKKGEFPYARLSQTAWGSKHLDGLPPLKEYNPDTKKPEDRKKLIKWWFDDQVNRNASNDIIAQVKEFLPDFETTYQHDPSRETIAWEFDKELWAYLNADVDVGAKAMYMYHTTAMDMQKDLGGETLTPLNFTTSPAWAKDMWQLFFMPEEEVATLYKDDAEFIRKALHGGRTDRRAGVVTLTDEAFERGDRIHYYDFKSLYPSVQKCSTHDTYYPRGRPDQDYTLVNKQDMTNEFLLEYMSNQTGFLEIDATHLKYVTHPTLCRIKNVSGEPKLMFTNEDTVKETYCWPEIEEAILSGEIKVTKVHKALVFARTTKTFNSYVDFFFKVKDDAEKVGNQGLRSLAKLMLNSLWGKLGQKSYAITEWVHTVEREHYLQQQFEMGAFELIACIPKTDAYIHYDYRIVHDYNNLNNTAVHVAAHVSTWGRVMLHRKVLRIHGQRALYCDTDSAIIYLRKDDTMPYVGDGLGDLTNEVPKILEDGGVKFTGEAYIREAVFVAPKTYALHIQTTCGVNYYKVVCKGFEPSYQNAKSFHFENFKKLVLHKTCPPTDEPPMHYIMGAPSLRFESSLGRNKITPTESYAIKKLTGDYDKGVQHPLDDCLVIPYGPFQPQASFLQELHPTKHYE